MLSSVPMEMLVIGDNCKVGGIFPSPYNIVKIPPALVYDRRSVDYLVTLSVLGGSFNFKAEML